MYTYMIQIINEHFMKNTPHCEINNMLEFGFGKKEKRKKEDVAAETIESGKNQFEEITV